MNIWIIQKKDLRRVLLLQICIENQKGKEKTTVKYGEVYRSGSVI